MIIEGTSNNCTPKMYALSKDVKAKKFFLLLCKILQSIVLTQVFRDVCASVFLSVCPSVCNNFLVYSITETILSGSSPPLVRTFLTSIPSLTIAFGLIWKNKMAVMPIFLLQTSHIPRVKLLLPSQPMHPHYIFPMQGNVIKRN